MNPVTKQIVNSYHLSFIVEVFPWTSNFDQALGMVTSHGNSHPKSHWSAGFLDVVNGIYIPYIFPLNPISIHGI